MLMFPKANRFKRYCLELGCGECAKKSFERWQRTLNHYETNVDLVHHFIDLFIVAKLQK